MSSSIPHGPAPDSAAGARPLPSKPSLEYERKQAKKFLAALQSGEPGAVARASSLGLASGAPFQLADAQLVIAREYGFRSWPRLVDYFNTLDRHVQSEREPTSSPPEHLERQAQSLIVQLRSGSRPVAATFARYVPRLFGSTPEDVLTAEITIDDARLTLARQHLCASWEDLLELSANSPRMGGWEHYEAPHVRASRAIRIGDLAELSALIDEHPELLGDHGGVGRSSLIRLALATEKHAVTGVSTPPRPSLVNAADARKLTDWLIARGADASSALNQMLLGHTHRMVETEPAEVEFLLARGGNPDWRPANGISVIEHALYRYGSGDAVDVLASRCTPPQAFWVAAGLGDTRSLTRYIDRAGRLTPAARQARPDFRAMGRAAFGMNPEPPDDSDVGVLWEAFLVAALNGRFAVMDRILETGFPVDYHAVGWTLLLYALTRRRIALVEYLISRGADPRGEYFGPSSSARSVAEMSFKGFPPNADLARALKLCGGDPTTTKSERHEAREPTIHGQLATSLKDAAADARRLGQSAVEPHNILVGLLRTERPELSLTYLWVGGVDIARLRRHLGERLTNSGAADTNAELPLSIEARNAMTAAVDRARKRYEQIVDPSAMLAALATGDEGGVADILRAAGSTPARMREVLDRG